MPKTIVAVGEALWDVFPDQRRPGGAPCNVAFHAARLGDRGTIVTRVGADALGVELVAFLAGQGVDTSYVQHDATRPTGTVSVSLASADPAFAITEDVAWDHLVAEPGARALARTADAICLGSLAQRGAPSREAIQRLLAEARGRALIVFDVNLRRPFVDPGVIDATLRAADVVKMNESEVASVETLLERPSIVTWLLEETDVRAVCVTRGPDGASITTRRETVSASGVEVDTSRGDTVGAGDAFTAAMAHQFVHRATLQHVVDAANRYAAVIASKRGAMPALSREELAAIGW